MWHGASAIHGGDAIYAISYKRMREPIYFCRRMGKHYRKCRNSETHKDDTLKPGLVPCHRVLFRNSVLVSDCRPFNLTLCHAVPGSAHDDVKVHAKDTDCGVVSRTEVDVLLDPETKVARRGKILSTKLVLLHLEATLEDFLGFGPTDRDVHGDLLIATDTELADSIAGLGRHGCLTGQLLEDFGSSCQTVTRLSDGYIYCHGGHGKSATGMTRRTDDELVDTKITHCV